MLEGSAVICSVPQCENQARPNRQHLCGMHIERLRRNGNVGPPGRVRKFPALSFEEAANEIGYDVTPLGCHEYRGPRDKMTGYGTVCAGGRQEKWHRYSWKRVNGPVPSGMYVCHRCDNPPCGNPEHLFLGSTTDNHDDMVRKERHPRGESHGNAVLTEAEVRSIRLEKSLGASSNYLARKHRVSEVNINAIVRRAAWKHVS